MTAEPTDRDVEALRAAALADLDVCPFAEDVNDASVCRLCRLPALGHDETAARITLENHPGVAALLDALSTAAERIAQARREGAATAPIADEVTAINALREIRALLDETPTHPNDGLRTSIGAILRAALRGDA